jgi:hypothetical protein
MKKRVNDGGNDKGKKTGMKEGRGEGTKGDTDLPGSGSARYFVPCKTGVGRQLPVCREFHIP